MYSHFVRIGLVWGRTADWFLQKTYFHMCCHHRNLPNHKFEHEWGRNSTVFGVGQGNRYRIERSIDLDDSQTPTPRFPNDFLYENPDNLIMPTYYPHWPFKFPSRKTSQRDQHTRFWGWIPPAVTLTLTARGTQLGGKSVPQQRTGSSIAIRVFSVCGVQSFNISLFKSI